MKSSKQGGDFMIAKVGDKEANAAYFCEIYQITNVPAEPWRGKAEHKINFLLARVGDESGRDLIGGVRMKDGADKIIFSIDLRPNPHFEATNVATLPEDAGILYDLVFTRNYQLRRNFLLYRGPQQIRSE